MEWSVILSKTCTKQLRKLPERVSLVLQLLIEDLRDKGPFPGSR